MTTPDRPTTVADGVIVHAARRMPANERAVSELVPSLGLRSRPAVVVFQPLDVGLGEGLAVLDLDGDEVPDDGSRRGARMAP